MSKVKIGQIDGPAGCEEIKMAASETFYKKYGRFVVKDLSADNWKVATNGENGIGGWVEDADETATSAGDKRMMNSSLEAKYEMPYYDGSTNVLTQAILDIIVGKKADIYVSTYQYADCSAIYTDEGGDDATDGVLIIVGGDVTNNLVHVKMLAEKQDAVA